MTLRGFWVVEALSRETRGFPWTLWFRIGKSDLRRAISGGMGTSETANSSFPRFIVELLYPLPLRQPCHQLRLEPTTDRQDFEAIQYLGGESIGEQVSRESFVHTAGAQIENLFFLQLAHRRPVAAFHVVGVDFHLRSAVRLGLARQKQVLVGLPGIRLLCILVHHHLAPEYPAGPAIQDTAEKYAAGAARFQVVDARVGIHMLALVSQVEAIEDALRPLSAQRDVDIVAGKHPPEGGGVGGEAAARPLVRPDCGDVIRVWSLFLDLVMGDRCVTAGSNLRHRVG